ncbi:MAG: hypothetical protein ACI8SJ_001177 [Shewanella sp.]|jgi:hypothetical protein
MSILVSSAAVIANISAFYLISLLGHSLLDIALAFSVAVLAGLIINGLGANFWTFGALNID